MGGAREPTAVLLAPAYDHDEHLPVESLGLRSVAAMLARCQAAVHVIDECPASVEGRLAELLASATLVGLGALFTRQVPDAMALARVIRQITSAHTTMGGQGTSFLWADILDECPEIDSVCMYEADETIVELWRAVTAKTPTHGIAGLCCRVDGKQAAGRPRPPVADLDLLPFPLRRPGKSGYPDGHATICASRGCAAHCSFCQSGNYGNRYHGGSLWRARSADRIVDEIVELRDRHAVTAISIVDDDFLGGDGAGRRRAVEFARTLRRRRVDVRFSIECRVDEIDQPILAELRDAGLRHVLIGVESANDADIRLFAKRTGNDQAEQAINMLRALGLDFSIGFIMFHPLSSVADIRLNIDFLRRNGICTYRRLTNRLELYPGAPLLSYFRRRNVSFRRERHRLYYDFADPTVAAAHALTRAVLRCFAPVERRVARLRFDLANLRGPVDHTAAGAVERIAADMSLGLAELALACLSAAEAEHDSALFAALDERARLRADAFSALLDLV